MKQKKLTKPKTTQNSTQPNILSKNYAPEAIYRPEGNLMNNPQSEAWRAKLCDTIIHWAKLPDSLEILDFSFEYGFPRNLIRLWANKYEDVGSAYEFAKLMIGSRKRKGALVRAYDKDVVFRDMHNYDDEWMKVDAYHAQLKNYENASKEGNTFIFQEAGKVVTKDELDNQNKQIHEE